MKYMGRFSSLAAVVLGMLISSSLQAETGRIVVGTVKGSADYSDGQGWKALRSGLVLSPGAVIRTSYDSQADLLLGQNGPSVRLKDSTELAVDRLEFDVTGSDVVIETKLNLRSGRILGTVKKTSSASIYEVKTPQGIANVKSGDYDISASGVVKVLDGSVLLAYVNKAGTSATQQINTGEAFGPTDVRPRPIPQGELEGLLVDIDQLKTASTGQGLVAVIPPQEPYVSPVVGSGSK